MELLNIEVTVCWIIIAICNLFSIFFSAADMAYSIVDTDKLEAMANNGKRSAKVALKIAKNYEFSIATILFGNNVANIFASSMVTILGTSWNPNWGVTAATILFTVILIIIAEFLPKAFAKRFNLTLSLVFAYPMVFFKYLFAIVVFPISKLFTLIGKLFKKKSVEEDIVDDDILSEMVDQMEDQGKLDENEAELVKGAIDLTDTEAHEIMTPRVDVFAIDIDEKIEDIFKQQELYKHSRIPVYKDNIDNIIGILPIKEIAKAQFKNEKITDLLAYCYQPIVVPRNHGVIDLLQEFKESKIHIAVIKDEYGGTEGIVTMEDILEEIVGDIFDETDEITEEYQDEGDGTYIVDGAMSIDDFFDLIDYKKEFETDYTTVSGLCQEILDRFAKVGDKFVFMERYLCFVLEADKFTVEKLKVTDLKYNEKEDE